MFSPSHRQLWMKKDDCKIALLSDKWQDGITPRATHRQTAATEETDVNKSPPPALIYRALPSHKDTGVYGRGLEKPLLYEDT